MRSAIVGSGLLLLSSTASAQSLCGALAPGFDPYNPSHAAIVRQYGGALMALAPLSTLLRLNPYVPADAALLRQVGNGIPVAIAYSWYRAAPPPTAPGCAPGSEPASAALPDAAAPLTTFAEMMRALEHRPGAAPAPGEVATPRHSSTERNRGLTITFAGLVWTSAGAAIPFQASDFVVAGERNGFPVYRRTRDNANVIYAPTMPGMMAPFRPAADR